ncbi:hypothetical protein MRX96_035795 [Rhipicephalus microplus]
MTLPVVFITCVHVFVLAADSPTQRPCSWSTADENVKDGYSFLDDDRRVYLVMTSSTKVLEMPYGARIRCISSVTTDKNDTEHELLETVDYKDSISGKWGKFSQRYRFVQSGEYFNEMELVERNGAPSGRYKFIYASRDCAVLMIEAFDVNMSEGGGEITDTSSGQESSSDAVKSEARTDETKSNIPDCMIWHKQGNTRALEISCEPYFSSCCKSKNADYTYTPNDCQIPEDRSDL